MVVGHNNSDLSPTLPSNQKYMALVGSLIYLAVITRPNIAFATDKVGQTMIAPTEANWTAAKRILRYLKGNPAQGLIYSNLGNHNFQGYCDSDWGEIRTVEDLQPDIYLH
jgi:hypothetical protein